MLYSRRKIPLLTYLLLILVVFGYGQELPPITNYTPQDYKAGDQNWSISQTSNNTIFIANNEGLLEFNGSQWTLYPTPNQTILRSVEVIGEKIFSGSYMDFGYWARNEFGVLEYKSLVDKLPVALIEDEEIWDIVHFEHWVLFHSFDRIYIYDTTTKIFKIIDSNSRINKIFKVENTVYYQSINKGVFKLENGGKVLVIPQEQLKNLEIINIFLRNSQLLLQTRDNGFYNFEDSDLKQWDVEANTTLKTISTYNSIRLKDGSFLLGTISNGLIQVSSDGDVILRIDQSRGLNNNTVLSLFEDTNGNIWLGLDNGINIINLDSPFRVYKDDMGILGTVYTSAKTEDYLYLGTNQGLFYRPINSNANFTFIKGTKGQVWSLDMIGNDLFCGHDKGTFLINETKVNFISNIKGTWCVKQIPNKTNLLIQGHYKGVSILHKTNEKWSLRNYLEGFNISSRFLEFLTDYKLFVSHEYKGLYKLELDANYDKIVSIKKEPQNKGINSSVFKYKDDIYYSYAEGTYKFNADKLSFMPDEMMSDIFKTHKYISGKVINDKTSGKLWMFTKDNLVYIQPGNLSNAPKISTIALPITIRKSKVGYENILHLDKNRYLLGTKEGYLIIDLNKDQDRSIKLNLNTVSHHILNEPHKFTTIESPQNFLSTDNNLNFNFSVPNYSKLVPTLYSYRLLGIHDHWSNWSHKSEAFFENLPYGDYTFQAKAKVGDKLSDNSIEYNFNIEKPWYLSPLAIVTYSILFLIIVVLVQYFNRRYYKNQQKRLLKEKERELEINDLENQQKLMELNNKNLKQDIDNKSRELGISTMNLIKRNELLNTIKDQLTQATDVSNLNKVVNLINKNLNTTNDWKLFEEAFNNADKDFLKTIKSKHPNLTSNDLRLCAYLRLNLSSKEIAPLLNISPRSVEVKRYRLRKKMELSQNVNLTDYILKI